MCDLECNLQQWIKTMIMLLHSNTTSKQISKFIDNFTFEKESLSITNKSVTFIISEITTTE